MPARVSAGATVIVAVAMVDAVRVGGLPKTLSSFVLLESCLERQTERERESEEAQGGGAYSPTCVGDEENGMAQRMRRR